MRHNPLSPSPFTVCTRPPPPPTGQFQAQPRRCSCPVAAPRGGLVPSPRWRTQTCEFPLTVPLNLADNRILDLWPPAYLTALERLNLAETAVEDLRPLARLTGLRVLLLDRNRTTYVLGCRRWRGWRGTRSRTSGRWRGSANCIGSTSRATPSRTCRRWGVWRICAGCGSTRERVAEHFGNLPVRFSPAIRLWRREKAEMWICAA